jgi:methylated-DNA-[protein]-cysteine S-methyltransferase
MMPDPAALAARGPASTGPDRTVLATVVGTPIGPLSLLARDGRLIAGGFTADPAEMHARLDPELRAQSLETTAPLETTGSLETAGPGDLCWLIKPIASYFDGDLQALDAIPVHQPGTPSRQRLWAALRAVPPGRTVTYTQLAVHAGCPHAPRAAGAACALNLIAPVVPCHRALRMDGSLGGYYYGLDRKTWLLRHEGVQGR